MMRLTVDKSKSFVVLDIDNSNHQDDFQRNIDGYVDTIRFYAKSAEIVFFNIIDLDMDGWWLNLANIWLKMRNGINIICEADHIWDTVIIFFDSRAIFYRSVEEAMKSIK